MEVSGPTHRVPLLYLKSRLCRATKGFGRVRTRRGFVIAAFCLGIRSWEIGALGSGRTVLSFVATGLIFQLKDAVRFQGFGYRKCSTP